MNFKKTKSGLFILVFSIGYAHAQEAVPATGGEGSGGNGMVSYSIGQVVYTASSGVTGSLNQGVQQPYDINTSSIGEELENIGVSVFPNPTEDVLILSLENTEISGYSYALYNQQGQLIEKKEMVKNQEEIFMRELTAASYILKVESAGKVVKSYTIIKH